jgi:hypothetical protein
MCGAAGKLHPKTTNTVKSPTLRSVLLSCIILNSVHADYKGTLVSATAPAQIGLGESLPVTFVVKNTGSITWDQAPYPSWGMFVRDFSWVFAVPGRFEDSFNIVDPGATNVGTLTVWAELLPQALGTYTMTAEAYHPIELRTGSYNRMSPSKTITFSIVDLPASITEHPVSSTVYGGSRFYLAVTTCGSRPIHHQWRFNGVNVADATNSYLIIAKAEPRHGGTYSVVVSNSLGVAVSSNAVISVQCNLSISPASSESFGYSGGFGSFDVNANCPWSITNPHAWITLTGRTNGDASGNVPYFVQPNNGAMPRVGTLKIGAEKMTVFQEPQPAPMTIRGKTLTMSVSSSEGTLPSWGKYLVVVRGGTNQLLQVLPISGPMLATNTPYTANRIDEDEFRFTFNGIQTVLSFATPVSGNFTVSKPDFSVQNGTFVMAHSSPDANADGRLDVLWQNASTRSLSAWLISGTNWIRTAALNFGTAAPLGWKAVGSADFNNDGHGDILFHTPSTGLTLWLMNRTNAIGVTQLRPGVGTGTNQTVVTAADFNGDSRADVLLQNRAGAMSLWTFSLTTYVKTISIRNGQSAGFGWKAVAAADFNRDRQTDILFQHDNGGLAFWLMNGVNFSSTIGLYGTPAMASTWRVIGAGDFDSDGEPDILWRNSTGEMRIWRMRNRAYLGTIILPASPSSAGFNCVSPK